MYTYETADNLAEEFDRAMPADEWLYLYCERRREAGEPVTIPTGVSPLLLPRSAR